MTFQEYLNDILLRVFPDGHSQRLRGRYSAWLRDFFIEAQRYMPQLQEAHQEYIQQDATFFSCGSSAFTAPKGKIAGLYTQLTTDGCDRVVAEFYPQDEYRRLVDRLVESSCTGEAPYGYYEVGSTYFAYPELPLGLQHATPDIDLRLRSRERFFSVFDGYVWTHPVIQSTETAVLRWKGIKTNWGSSDEVPWKDEIGDEDRRVMALAELYLQWKAKLYDDCDENGAMTFKALYDRAFAELKVELKDLETPESRQPNYQ
jgi:hypothetical protein